MKNIFYSILLIVGTFFLNSCTEDTPIFIADLSSEEITFQNTFASDYLLSEETEDNIADRFIWNETTLGTNNDYEVQGSIDPLFGTFTSIGTTNETNYPVLVGQLLTLAFQLDLDDDPTTGASSGKVVGKIAPVGGASAGCSGCSFPITRLLRTAASALLARASALASACFRERISTTRLRRRASTPAASPSSARA